MPYGAQAKYFNKELVKQEGWEYNPARRWKLGTGAKGSDGIYVCFPMERG